MLAPRLRSTAFVTFTILSLLTTSSCVASSNETLNRPPLSLANISREEIPPDGTVSELTGVVKSYEHRTLPGRVLQGVDPLILQYAEDVYVSACLTTQGLPPSPVQQYDWNSPNALKGRNGWGAAQTVEEAQKVGFRTPLNEEGKKLDALLSEVEGRGEAYYSAFLECQEHQMRDPLFNDMPWDIALFPEDSASNPLMKSAADEWYECMKPLGPPDLEKGDTQVPDSLIEKFVSQSVDNPDLSDTSKISSEEIEAATFVARCYDESKVDRINYDLNWVGDERYMMEHKAEYQAVLTELEQREQKLKDYIEANRHLIS